MSLWSSIAKGVGAVGGFLLGGPAGAAAGVGIASSLTGKRGPTARPGGVPARMPTWSALPAQLTSRGSVAGLTRGASGLASSGQMVLVGGGPSGLPRQGASAGIFGPVGRPDSTRTIARGGVLGLNPSIERTEYFSPAGPAACATKGRHLNKSGYYVITNGQRGRMREYTDVRRVEPGTVEVPNRRMNPLNPKAASRAVRRLLGFHRATKRVEKTLQRVARKAAPRAPRAAFGKRK